MIDHRIMTRDDLAHVLDWAADEGWNPGLDDAEAFLGTDPGGFFLATECGAPVAAVSVVNHSDRFAFLGLYLCRPTHRGRGIGIDLWNRAIRHAGQRTIGLDGVEAQQANYERSGFLRKGATTRYEGHVAPATDPAIRAARVADIPRLVEMEHAASGWRKERYLTGWFTDTATRRTLVIEGPEGLAGLVTIRRCRTGCKIGPLIARTPQDALRLMSQATASLEADSVMIDVPAGSLGLDGLCRDLGMVPGFRTARMYRGPCPQAPEGVFAVATLELG